MEGGHEVSGGNFGVRQLACSSAGCRQRARESTRRSGAARCKLAASSRARFATQAPDGGLGAWARVGMQLEVQLRRRGAAAARGAEAKHGHLGTAERALAPSSARMGGESRTNLETTQSRAVKNSVLWGTAQLLTFLSS